VSGAPLQIHLEGEENMQRSLAIGALALLLVSPAVFGQAQKGSISVTVADADGQRLPGATVTAVSSETLTRRTVITDATGEAMIVALDPAINYVVTVSLDGFSSSTVNEVVVRAGQTQALSVAMGLAAVSEELIVTSESPLVDVSKTQAGQNITLQLTESLPTTRGYQGYLQLVPGVQDALGSSENPASRSGINYRDRKKGDAAGTEGGVGRSSDNLYYFDGINVTDRTLGTNGANLNTEIIQEQSVITGAIPAEFVGVPGLVSNVITKSGGNQFSGSVNYYLQNDSLVESDDHFAEDTFSTFDTAFTLGGPIWRDKAWFFGSFRYVETERDLVNENSVFLRKVKREDEQGFGKITWAPTNSDVFTGIYLTDPRDESGSFLRSVPNSADGTFERGGQRYSASYNRVQGSASLEAGFTDHEADTNEFPKNDSEENLVSFAPGEVFTSAEEEVGGAGEIQLDTRTTESARISLEYLFDSSWGDHALKAGFNTADSELQEQRVTSGSPPATYISLSARGLGTPISLCDVIGCGGGSQYSTADFGLSTDEMNGLRENLSATQMATLLGLWDDNNNGVLDDTEIINNMTFGSTAGNPHGQINYTRDEQVQAGTSIKGSESKQYFIQDSWQWNKWSVNAGVRAEDTTFITDIGEDIGTWDTEIAPRVSVAYDVKGDGRSSVGVFYGEYYDAFRDNAIDFAGSKQGNVFEEQVYVDALGEWVNFRDRGGLRTIDGTFAPRIETPVTEELQIQYKQDLGNNMMFEINLIDRETTGIAEDYGSIYFDASQYTGDFNASDALFLGPQFFGFNSFGDIPTNFNFLIGSLPGEAFRDYQGVELVFRKRYADNWQMIASYNYADAEGNSNSDGNFDGAGDVFPLDPRAPNRTGPQPGLVEHLFKVHGSYDWDNGFQVGGSYRWNSGLSLNRNSGQAFDRSLPDFTDTPFAARGFDGLGGLFGSTWIAEDAIGFFPGSSYGVLDVRASYLWAINDRVEADFFVDVFNILDDQQLIRVQTLETGGEGFAFGEGIDFVQPRRIFLGARARF
jgi:hypothetical protein